MPDVDIIEEVVEEVVEEVEEIVEEVKEVVEVVEEAVVKVDVEVGEVVVVEEGKDVDKEVDEEVVVEEGDVPVQLVNGVTIITLARGFLNAHASGPAEYAGTSYFRTGYSTALRPLLSTPTRSGRPHEHGSYTGVSAPACRTLRRHRTWLLRRLP